MSIVLRFFFDSLSKFITKCDNFIAKCDSYYKMRYLLQITLFNLITGRREVEAIPTLRKNCSPFTLFLFVNNPLSNDQMKVFKYSIYTFLPTQPLLINHIFSWKSKLKHTGVDITCFFSRCKIFTNKT